MAHADAPWVIVAGGFHDQGGMDRANAALARHLLAAGMPVHLVGHEIEDAIAAAYPRAALHRVPRPRGLPGVAEALLARAGSRIAQQVRAQAPDARVVANGGNCVWPDVNWVHAVHAVWPVHDAGAPAWLRLRHRMLKEAARRRERAALSCARLVIANSRATAEAIVTRVGIDPGRVRTLYLGCDAEWLPATASERRAARIALRLDEHAPVVAFVGALGADTNKGFDVLWNAWRGLSRDGAWDAQLVVAGGGWRLPRWEAESSGTDLPHPVRFLGATSRVGDVLAAADLLVSPVRYEAYGLNVHEALACGLAVMVTRSAGVVERFASEMSEALLPDATSPAHLGTRLRVWRQDMQGWRVRTESTAAAIRARCWRDMAAEFVELVHAGDRRAAA